eukprot:Pgem_evm1s20087
MRKFFTPPYHSNVTYSERDVVLNPTNSTIWRAAKILSNLCTSQKENIRLYEHRLLELCTSNIGKHPGLERRSSAGTAGHNSLPDHDDSLPSKTRE